MHDKAIWPLTKRAARGFRGYPIATVALYGRDDRRASEVSVGAHHEHTLVITKGAPIVLTAQTA